MNDGGRKTVLLVTPGGRHAPGGIARMADYCLRAWPEDSPFALCVIDTYGPGSKLLMPFFALRGFAAVLGLLLTGSAQLLHINLSERLSLWRKGAFVLLGPMFRVPVIIHLHGAEFAEQMRAGSPALRRSASALLRRARKLIVLGSYWREFLTQEMGIEPDKIAVLCNAVPDTGGKKTRETREECRILFLGALSERKGVSTLLEALAGEEMKPLRWSAIIAGGGAAEAYRDMTAELGIAARVSFPGLLTERQTRDALAQADIFALPSRREGLPVAILEALSYGCPVVATPVGSVPDAVIDEVSGILVPTDDTAALGSALARLVADSAYRERLGAGARALYKKKFTIAAYCSALEEIYRDITLSHE